MSLLYGFSVKIVNANGALFFGGICLNFITFTFLDLSPILQITGSDR